MNWNSEDWTEPTIELIRTVADMDEPVYVVDQDAAVEFDPRLRGGSTSAWTGPLLDLNLRGYLESVGRWQGRGFATVVDRSVNDRLHVFVGTCLHEVGHYLTFHDMAVGRNSELADLVLKLAKSEKGQPSTEMADPSHVLNGDREPWYGHGIEFIRASCHLAYRANKLVPWLRPRFLNFSKPYTRTAEADWVDLFADELQQRQDEPIRAILNSEPPTVLVETWNRLTGQEN